VQIIAPYRLKEKHLRKSYLQNYINFADKDKLISSVRKIQQASGQPVTKKSDLANIIK